MSITVTAAESFAGIGTVDGTHVPSGWSVSSGGSWRKRTGGPRKSTDAAGRGGAMLVGPSTADQITHTMAAGKFWVGDWLLIDERVQVGGGYGQDAVIPFQVGDSAGDRGCAITFTPSTRALNCVIRWFQDTFWPPNNVGNPDGIFGTSLPNMDCKWIYVLYAFDPGAGADTGEGRWYYQLPGGNLTLWASNTGMGTKPNGGVMDTAMMGQNLTAYWTTSPRFQGRVGMLGYGTFDSFADFPTNASFTAARGWVDPPTSGGSFHVKRTAGGAGDGSSAANAWTMDQLCDEAANGGFMATKTPLLYKGTTNAVANTVDVFTLERLYLGGSLTFNGDAIYLDDEGGELRLGQTLTYDMGIAGAVTLPEPGKTANINGSIVIAPVLVNGETILYSVPCTQTYAVLYRNGVLCSPVGSAVTNTIKTACRAATTTDVYGFDGTTLWIGAPNGVGATYELTQNSGINFTGAHLSLLNVSIRKIAAVTSAAAGSNNVNSAYNLNFNYAGLSIIDNVYASHFAKHGIGAATTCMYPTGSRTIVRNCTAEGGLDAAIVGNGGHTAGVFFVDTSVTSTSTDNQILWRNFTAQKNVQLVGSSTFTSDGVYFNAWLMHTSNLGDPVHPFTGIYLFGMNVCSMVAQANGQVRCQNPIVVDATSIYGGAWVVQGGNPGEGVPAEGVTYLGGLTATATTDADGVTVDLSAACANATAIRASLDGGTTWMTKSGASLSALLRSAFRYSLDAGSTWTASTVQPSPMAGQAVTALVQAIDPINVPMLQMAVPRSAAGSSRHGGFQPIYGSL